MAKRDNVDNSGLNYSELDLQVRIYTDGSRTEAVIINQDGGDDEYLESGVAKRRKGEKPKPRAAMALAIARSLRNLSEAYYKRARIEGLPEAGRRKSD